MRRARASDDGNEPPDSRGVSDRGAAEFLNDHVWSLYTIGAGTGDASLLHRDVSAPPRLRDTAHSARATPPSTGYSDGVCHADSRHEFQHSPVKIPNLDARSSNAVARQPILNASGQVFAYDLLYRCDEPGPQQGPGADVEAARVISDVVSGLGLETLTSGRPAVLRMTHSLILNGFPTLLPLSVVLDIDGSRDVDNELVEACDRMRQLGYTISVTAPTGHQPGTPLASLIQLAKYVRLDLAAHSSSDVVRLRRQLAPGARLIACNVRTHDACDRALIEGFSLFQGYYFCTPSTLSAPALVGQRVVYARLLAALNEPTASVAAIEDLIKHDPTLSVRVLRCVNSASFGLKPEISSISHAIVYLGLEQVRKWASVWALAGVSSSAKSELMRVAVLRARTCELLAARAGITQDGEYFLLGLCSLLDAMLGRPIANLIDSVPLSAPIKAALAGEAGPARSTLDALRAFEQGDWDNATKACLALGLPLDALTEAYNDALYWAHELTELAATA